MKDTIISGIVFCAEKIGIDDFPLISEHKDRVDHNVIKIMA